MKLGAQVVERLSHFFRGGPHGLDGVPEDPDESEESKCKAGETDNGGGIRNGRKSRRHCIAPLMLERTSRQLGDTYDREKGRLWLQSVQDIETIWDVENYIRFREGKLS